MAKDSDKKAGALGAKKTGVALSGLLAEENEFDRRTLWRIGWWGAAALSTVVVAVLANQAALDGRRDRVSSADLARQTQLIQSLARDSQSEQRQLASAIETLNSDRDRLYARVTVLEQSLDSVTGALAKQSGAPASSSVQPAAKAAQSSAIWPEPQPVASSSPVPPSGGPVPPTTVSSTISSGAPSVAPVATATTGPDSARSEPPKTGAGSVQAAHAQIPVPNTPASSSSNLPMTAAGASLVAPKSVTPPADSAGGKAIEPDKVANADTGGPAATGSTATASSEADAVPAQKTEFAVDLGGANSVNGLRALWRGLAKSHKELAALRPIIIVKEGAAGYGMQLRLGAGPLADAAAAARLCATLTENQRPCETTVYDGQRLAIRGDEAEQPDTAKPAAQKPAYPQRRRAAPPQAQLRHGAVREEPPAPAAPPPPAAAPAESSSMPSFLRRS